MRPQHGPAGASRRSRPGQPAHVPSPHAPPASQRGPARQSGQHKRRRPPGRPSAAGHTPPRQTRRQQAPAAASVLAALEEQRRRHATRPPSPPPLPIRAPVIPGLVYNEDRQLYELPTGQPTIPAPLLIARIPSCAVVLRERAVGRMAPPAAARLLHLGRCSQGPAAVWTQVPGMPRSTQEFVLVRGQPELEAVHLITCDGMDITAFSRTREPLRSHRLSHYPLTISALKRRGRFVAAAALGDAHRGGSITVGPATCEDRFHHLDGDRESNWDVDLVDDSGTRLVVGRTGGAKFVDLRRSNHVQLQLSSDVMCVKAAAQTLMLGCRNGQALMWDVRSPAATRAFRVSTVIEQLLELADGATWVVSHADGGLAAFDVRFPTKALCAMHGKLDGVKRCGLMADSDSHFIVAPAVANTLAAWEVLHGHVIWQSKPLDARPSTVALWHDRDDSLSYQYMALANGCLYSA